MGSHQYAILPPDPINHCRFSFFLQGNPENPQALLPHLFKPNRNDIGYPCLSFFFKYKLHHTPIVDIRIGFFHIANLPPRFFFHNGNESFPGNRQLMV